MKKIAFPAPTVRTFVDNGPVAYGRRVEGLLSLWNFGGSRNMVLPPSKSNFRM